MDQLGNALKVKKSGRVSRIERLGDLRSKRGRRGKRQMMGGDLLINAWGGTRKKRRVKNIEKQQDQAMQIRRKLTPTERQQLNAEVEKAIEDDQDLRNQRNDATLTRDEGFVRRLVALVRARLRRA